MPVPTRSRYGIAETCPCDCPLINTLSSFLLATLQIIKVESIAASKTRRAHIKQFHNSKIRFPLVQRYHHKRYRKLFSYRRPETFYQ